MRRLHIVTCAVSVFALTAGCSRRHELTSVRNGDEARILNAITMPMPDCQPADDKIIGVIRIKMPKKFKFEDIGKDRKITHEPGAPGDSDGPLDAGGKDNNPVGPILGPLQPFDIHLSSVLANMPYVAGKGQYILVRVIIQKGSNYTFYKEPLPGIQGVGTGQAEQASKIVCGIREVVDRKKSNDTNSEARSVASFFINIDKMRGPPLTSAGFNIGIQPEKAILTPIFIDPKIHNEG